MLVVADRVRETSTTSGTGALTLAGAVSGFRRFSDVCSVGDVVYYVIVDGSSWEVGVGTYSATNTLTRTTILSSSNSGSAVSFSSSSKDVILTAAAAYCEQGFALRNLLENSSFEIYQRLAESQSMVGSGIDGAMIADGWYVLASGAGPANVLCGPKATGGLGTVLTNNDTTTQKLGIGQCLWGTDTLPLIGSVVRVGMQVKVTATTGTVRCALLEWTGTKDAATRDVVNNWSSTTYTTGNFFKSTSFTLNGITSVAISSSSTWYNLDLVSGAISSSANNLILFIWYDQDISTSLDKNTEGLFIRKPVMVQGSAPASWVYPQYASELQKMQRRFCKTFQSGTTPSNNAGFEGCLSAQSVGSTLDPEINWRFPVRMGKTPTVTLYNPDSGTAGQWDEAGSAALANARAYYIGQTGCTIDNTDIKPVGGQSWFIHATAEAEPSS